MDCSTMIASDGCVLNSRSLLTFCRNFTACSGHVIGVETTCEANLLRSFDGLWGIWKEAVVVVSKNYVGKRTTVPVWTSCIPDTLDIVSREEFWDY